MLIVLDDLQKADSCTVRMLDYLVRSNDKEGPQFISTVCNEDILKDEEGRSNISDFLSNASLDGLCRTVELGEHLPGGQRHHGLGTIPVQPAEGTRSKRSSQSSRGNPLMALELTKSVASAFANEFRGEVAAFR